jgi:iron complex transport system substrate-binding protein
MTVGVSAIIGSAAGMGCAYAVDARLVKRMASRGRREPVRSDMVRGLLIAVVVALGAARPAAAGPRVYSLDQCADQYVLALVPRGDIAALSHRADDADSYLRGEADGLPRRRASLEPILASRATVVVRYWGGDLMLARALEQRGVKVVTIDDATNFSGVRADIRKVSAALGQPAKGETLVGRMDAELSRAKGAGRNRPVMYMTSGGFTAGEGTLVGAMLSAAGLRNLAGTTFFEPVPLERLALSPPAALVLGYFDAAALAVQRWAFGRHHLVRKIARERTLTSLPSSILGCPAWFAGDGPALLAKAERRQ